MADDNREIYDAIEEAFFSFMDAYLEHNGPEGVPFPIMLAQAANCTTKAYTQGGKLDMGDSAIERYLTDLGFIKDDHGLFWPPKDSRRGVR